MVKVRGLSKVVVVLSVLLLASLAQAPAASAEPVGFTVTYNGNGNDGGSAPVDSNSPYGPAEAVLVRGNIADPRLTRSGFTFVGWNSASDGGGTAYGEGQFFLPTKSLTMYAQWSGDVSYSGNGNTGGDAPAPSPYLAGQPVTVADPGSLAKEGFSFSGWNTQADGGGTSYSVDEVFAMAGTVTLYAVWIHDPYSVTYDGNGHTGGSVPQDGDVYEPGSMATILGNTGALTKTGYRFSGWNTAANGSGTTLLPDAMVVIDADTTFYAKWTPLDNGGSSSSSESTGPGASITPAPAPQAPPAPAAWSAPSHSWSSPIDDLLRLLASGALIDTGNGLPTLVTPTQDVFSFYGPLGTQPPSLMLGQIITTPLGPGSCSLGGVIRPQSPTLVPGSPSVAESTAGSQVSLPSSADLAVGSGGSLVFFGTDALPGSPGTVILSGSSVGGPQLSAQPLVWQGGPKEPGVPSIFGPLVAQVDRSLASVKSVSTQAASAESVQQSGTFAVAADGTYRGAFQVPANAAPGRMFVQFATYSPDGRVQAVVFPVTVAPAVATLRAPVVFPYEASTLTATAKKQLRHLASQVPVGTTLTSVAVGLRNGTRHSDSDTLAMSRAKAVAKYLAQLGVSTSYRSARPDKPLPNTATSRRVDTMIQYEVTTAEGWE